MDDAALAQIEPELEIPPEPDLPQAPDDYGQTSRSPLPAPADRGSRRCTRWPATRWSRSTLKPDIDIPQTRLPPPGHPPEGHQEGRAPRAAPRAGTALPNGGFACASKGPGGRRQATAVPAPTSPPPPRMDQSLPYRYAYVRKWNSPNWWRIPTAEELSRGRHPDERCARPSARVKSRAGERARIQARNPKTKPEARGQSRAPPPAPAADAEIQGPTQATDEPEAASPKPEAKPKAAPEPARQARADGRRPRPSRPPPRPRSRRPSSLAAQPRDRRGSRRASSSAWPTKITEDGKSWWHTSRGAYVEASRRLRVRGQGFLRGRPGRRRHGFPFGYAMVKEAKVYEMTEDGSLEGGRQAVAPHLRGPRRGDRGRGQGLHDDARRPAAAQEGPAPGRAPARSPRASSPGSAGSTSASPSRCWWPTRAAARCT